MFWANAANSRVVRLVPVVVGYAVACFAAALAMIVISALPNLSQINSLAMLFALPFGLARSVGLFFLIAVVTAWPGFILLRGGLHLLRRKDRFSFLLAGAINAVVTLIVFNNPLEFSLTDFIQYPPNPITLVYGGIAGLACWSAERTMLRRVEAREQRAAEQ